jgi:DeoR/GlpR family transcriptional regulator of sugar metabolism
VKPSERRQAIWETLCRKQHETSQNLASELGVSLRTIQYDIEQLSLSHPIETIRGRHGGGVKVSDCYQPKRKVLNLEQAALLRKLTTSLSNDDRMIMNSIITQFAP